jgi:hypothetical protein
MSGELVVIEDHFIGDGAKETLRIDLHVHIHMGEAAGFRHGESSFEEGSPRGASRAPSGVTKILSIFFISMAVTGGGFMVLKGVSGPGIKDLWTADHSKMLAEAAESLENSSKGGDYQLWHANAGAPVTPSPNPNPPVAAAPPRGAANPSGAVNPGLSSAPSEPPKSGPGLFGLN